MVVAGIQQSAGEIYLSVGIGQEYDHNLGLSFTIFGTQSAS